MKTSVRILAASIAIALVASTAMAQNQGRGGRGQGGRGGFGGFGMGGDNSSMLLQNEKVQKELELSSDQVEQVKKIASESRESFTDLQDLSREERMTKFREAGEKSKKKINEVLLPHQKDRLKELQIQLAGPRALLQEDIAEKLNLSSEQKEKLNETVGGRGGFGGFGGRGQGQGGERPSREEINKAIEERNQKAMDILTDEQKDMFTKMKGKKSDITNADLFGGGRGQGGRGQGGGRGNGEGRGRGEGRAPRDA